MLSSQYLERRWILFSCFVFIILMASPAYVIAAKGDAVFNETEDDFFTDMPVVVSATRLLQPLRDVPEAMTVIDRRTIEASGAQTISDVLRLIPGFQVGQVTGSRATVTYHGFSDRFARTMEVLVDGRSVYDAANGMVAWTDLPLAIEDINRIEVMRGPNAAAHGANAFSATINIITRKPFEQLGLSSNITRGNPDSNKVLLSYAGVAENLEYRITTRYDDNEGIETRFDDSKTQMINFVGNYQLNIRDSLFFSLGVSDGDRDDGLPQVPINSSNVYHPERTIEHGNSYQQLKWTRSFSVDSEYSIQFYHNHQVIDDDFETSVTFSEFDPALPTVIDAYFGQTDQRLKLGYGFDSDRYDLEFQHRYRFNDDLRIAWGGGARIDEASGFSTFGSNETVTRNQLRMFINAEWFALSQLVFNVGTMVEKVDGISTQWLPRFAANYHINRHHTLRFSVAEAIRIPTLVEDSINRASRFQDGAVFDYIQIGPGDLQPEELRSTELGYIANFPQLGLNWDFKIFRDDFDNRIVDPRDLTCLENQATGNTVIPAFGGDICEFFEGPGGSASYRGVLVNSNHGSGQIEGYELGLNWDISKATWMRLAYAYTDSFTEEAGKINPLQLRRQDDLTPDVTYALLLAHKFPKNIQFSAAYYHLDEMDWEGEGDSVPAYNRLDLRLAKSFKISNVSGKLAFIAQNIGDEYADFQEQNIMRKRYYLSLDLIY